MERGKGTTASRKGKHLNHTERILIEKLLKAGLGKTEIARQLDRDYSTIRRELACGTVERLNRDLTVPVVYNADRAQDVRELNASAKGAPVKLMAGRSAVLFISYYIRIKRWSPEAVAARMKTKGMPDALCAKSIYNYIEQGWIPGVANETLWEKRKRRKNARKTLRRSPPRAPQRRKRIDERPVEVDRRTVFGHWEIGIQQPKAHAAVLCPSVCLMGTRKQRERQSNHPQVHPQRCRHGRLQRNGDPRDRGMDKQVPA